MMKLEIYPVLCIHPTPKHAASRSLHFSLSLSLNQTCSVPYFNTESQRINRVAELSISSCSLSLSLP